MAQDCASTEYWRLAKVTSFYLSSHDMNFKNWLLFERCFVFIVNFLGYIKGERTLKSFHTFCVKNGYMVIATSTPTNLPPSHGDRVLASRTTLFEGGGEMM